MKYLFIISIVFFLTGCSIKITKERTYTNSFNDLFYETNLDLKNVPKCTEKGDFKEIKEVAKSILENYKVSTLNCIESDGNLKTIVFISGLKEVVIDR